MSTLLVTVAFSDYSNFASFPNLWGKNKKVIMSKVSLNLRDCIGTMKKLQRRFAREELGNLASSLTAFRVCSLPHHETMQLPHTGWVCLTFSGPRQKELWPQPNKASWINLTRKWSLNGQFITSKGANYEVLPQLFPVVLFSIVSLTLLHHQDKYFILIMNQRNFHNHKKKKAIENNIFNLR